MTTYHEDLTGTNIHVPYSWSYGTASARLAASGFVAGDIGKLALQEDDNTLWMLTATTPTWSNDGDAAATVIPHGGTFVPTLPASLSIASQGIYNVLAYGSDASAPLLAAIAAIGATPATLLVSAGVTVAAGPLVIPATLTLKVLRGGIITVNNGVTLTIGSLEAGLYQVFNCLGTGKIAFETGKVPEVYPEWFGVNAIPGTTDMMEAIQSAVDSLPAAGGTVKFGQTIYLIKGKYATLANASRITDGVKIKSNVTFRGDGAASIIRQDENCCFSFTTRLLAAVTDPATNVHDVGFYNLQFDKPAVTWFEMSHLLNMESITNLTVRDCSFIGWSGDAICFGAMTDAGLGSWLQSYVRNIVITNNIFDGVTKDNRQALSFICGENISITNNYFVRTTRVGMPGAIDFEPERVDALVSNVNIQSNVFEDIGGGGTISLLLPALTLKASNINVLDNIFKNNTSYFSYVVLGPVSASQTVVAANSPERIRFAGNTIYSTTSSFFAIGGAKDITIENETYVGNPSVEYLVFPSYIGSFWPDTIRPVENLHFINNTIKNYVIDADYTIGVLSIYRLTGGEISGNVFIDSGNTNPGNPIMNCIAFGGATNVSSNLKIANNSFVNNALFNADSFPIFFPAGSPLLYPDTITIRNNHFIGFDNTPFTSIYSAYKICPSDKYPGFITLTNSATPSVAGGDMFLTGGTTTITNFVEGQVGQRITIISEHAIIITDGTNIFLAGSTNFTMAATGTLTLIQKADGKWYELNRSVN